MQEGETRNEVQLLLHVHKMRAKQTGSTHQAINLNLVNPLSRHRRRSTGVCHGSQEPTPALSRTRAHNTQKLNVPSFQVSKFPNFQTFGSSFSHLPFTFVRSPVSALPPAQCYSACRRTIAPERQLSRQYNSFFRNVHSTHCSEVRDAAGFSDTTAE